MLVLWRPGRRVSGIVGIIGGENIKKPLLPPARDKSFSICRELRRRLIGLRMRRVKGLRMTLSAYPGSRFVEMEEVSEE